MVLRRGLGAACAAACIGCASTRVTNPERTATEQFLLSKAAADAVGQLSFEALRGRDVYVDTLYFAASEQAFVLGELRARMLMGGIQLVERHEEAEVVLEVRSGGVGIDRNDFLLGIPAVPLTPVDAPFSTPELAFVKNTYQKGVASVAYIAYWRESGEVVASSGPFIGRTFRDDWWFFGVGPRTRGNIETTERTSQAPIAEPPGEAAADGAGPDEP